MARTALHEVAEGHEGETAHQAPVTVRGTLRDADGVHAVKVGTEMIPTRGYLPSDRPLTASELALCNGLIAGYLAGQADGAVTTGKKKDLSGQDRTNYLTQHMADISNIPASVSRPFMQDLVASAAVPATWNLLQRAGFLPATDDVEKSVGKLAKPEREAFMSRVEGVLNATDPDDVSRYAAEIASEIEKIVGKTFERRTRTTIAVKDGNGEAAKPALLDAKI